MRPPDIKKILLIINVLKKYPEGIWFRRISQETKLPASTVFYYLQEFLEPFVENIGYKNEQGRFVGIRIVKLKKDIQLTDVLKYLKLKRSIR